MPQRTCPKCGYSQPDTSDECSQCGVVFAKYHASRDAMLDRTSARIGEPPAEPKRIRPLTFLLLFAYLALGWYAIRSMDIWDNPATYLGPEDGISRGGDTFVRERRRVAVEAQPVVEEGDWEGLRCFGIKVFEGAEPLRSDDGTAMVNFQGEPTEFVVNAPYEEVTEFYRGIFGPTRVFFEQLEPPASHPNPESVGQIDGRRAKWYAMSETPDGMSIHVDVQVSSPFFATDGTLHADGTLVAFALMK